MVNTGFLTKIIFSSALFVDSFIMKADVMATIAKLNPADVFSVDH